MFADSVFGARHRFRTYKTLSRPPAALKRVHASTGTRSSVSTFRAPVSRFLNGSQCNLNAPLITAVPDSLCAARKRFPCSIDDVFRHRNVGPDSVIIPHPVSRSSTFYSRVTHKRNQFSNIYIEFDDFFVTHPKPWHRKNPNSILVVEMPIHTLTVLLKFWKCTKNFHFFESVMLLKNNCTTRLFITNLHETEKHID